MILTRCTSTTTLFWLLTVLNLASCHYICGLYCLFLSVFLLHLLCTSISLCLPGKTCFYLNHAVLCTYVSLCLYVFTNADKSPGYNVSNECFCKPLICLRFTSVANLAYRIHSHCAYVCLLAPCLIAFNKAAKWARGVKTIFSWLCSDQNRYFKPNHDAILTLTKWLLCLGINTALTQKRNRKSNPILMFPFCTETYLAHNYSGDCADHMSFFVKHFGAKTCLRLKCLHTQDKLGFLLGWWVKHKLFQTH